MHSLIRNVLSKNSIIQLLLGLAGNTQRQQIPMQSFKAIRAVNNDDYLRHEFSDRQIPKVLLMCLTKICRTVIPISCGTSFDKEQILSLKRLRWAYGKEYKDAG
jgi:hypothetical protein